MKPYRVKRGNKFIGSYLVVHDGQRVNLATKDADEARRRAILVKKGQWPETNTAVTAVKEALEGKEPPDETIPPASDPPLPEAFRSPDVMPHPVPVRGPDLPGTPLHAEPVTPAAADAVNQTVAASVDEAERLAAEAKVALADAGIDMAELRAQAPRLLSAAHLWVQGQLARVGVRVTKGKWPALVTLPPEDELRRLLGQIDVVMLSRLSIDVEKVGLGWWFLAVSAVTVIAQVGTMLEALKAEGVKAAVN